MSHPKVAISILNWNGKEVLLDCLSAVHRLEYPVQQVLVVDNASTDGSQEAVRMRFPNVQLLQNEQNLGSVARNAGLRWALGAGADYVWLLDNDIIVDPASLDQMIALAEADPRAGIVGGKLFFYGSSELLYSTGGIIDFTQNVHRNRGTGELDRGQYDRVESVDCIGHAYMFLRCSMLRQVGLLDPAYIGYGFGDTEFCSRARRCGYKVMYCPQARFWHKHELSDTNRRYTFKKKYLEARNAVRFVRAYGGPAQRLKYGMYATLSIPYALLRESWRGNLPGVYGKVRGLIDGLRDDDAMAERLLDTSDV